MAKMFYSMEEVQAKLGVGAEGLKQLVEEGKLREFRDGAKIMFKVDEVDAFNPDAAVEAAQSSDDIGLAPLGDSGELAPLGDTGEQTPLSESGSNIPLSPMDESVGIGSSIGLAPLGDSADQISLEDSGQQQTDKDDTVITSGSSEGFNLLDDSDEDMEFADPMAQTQMAPDFADQVAMDSGASGSGLLDLTHEADDTSLGAEVLDDIYAAGNEGAIETQLPTAMDIPERSSAAPGSMSTDQIIQPEPMVQYVQAAEMVEPGNGYVAVGLFLSFLLLVYLTFVAAAGVAGVRPRLLESLSSGVVNWSVVGIVGGLAAILMIVGFMTTGSASSGKKKEKGPKPPKEKKSKKKKK